MVVYHKTIRSSIIKQYDRLNIKQYDRLNIKQYDRLNLKQYDRLNIKQYDRLNIKQYDLLNIKQYDRLNIKQCNFLSFFLIFLSTFRECKSNFKLTSIKRWQSPVYKAVYLHF